MAKKIVLFVEDAQWVGIWASYVDAIRQLVLATDGGTIEAIDSTLDGWFGDGPAEITRQSSTVYSNNQIRSLVPAGWTLVAVEDKATDLSSGPSRTIFCSHFFDASNGVLGCSSSKIYDVSDSGGTQPEIVVQSDVYEFGFADDDLTGWACQNHGDLDKTTDGGATWTPQTTGVGDKALEGIWVDDDQTAVIVGKDGTIIRTSDGGATWTPATTVPNTTDDLKAVTFTDSNKGYAVGSAGAIWRTEDGGDTWTAQTSGTTEILYDVKFQDHSKGWAFGDNGTILRTTDTGTTWTAQTSGTLKNLYDAWYVSSSEVIVVGEDGTMLRTTDTGVTWPAVTSPTTDHIYSISKVGTTIYTGGAGGANSFFRSDDDGVTWIGPATGAKVDLAVYTHPDNAVYVFGDHSGLDRQFIQPDVHLHIDNLTDTLDVRDTITMVISDRFSQLPTEP